jgi:hypothetical protein
VRCYLKPEADKRRLHRIWKAGLFVDSSEGAHWKGSRKKWGTIDLPASAWVSHSRSPGADDYPAKRYLSNVIECENENAHYTMGVPKPDTELCLAVLTRPVS